MSSTVVRYEFMWDEVTRELLNGVQGKELSPLSLVDLSHVYLLRSCLQPMCIFWFCFLALSVFRFTRDKNAEVSEAAGAAESQLNLPLWFSYMLLAFPPYPPCSLNKALHPTTSLLIIQ
jgi:hypothetical protein